MKTITIFTIVLLILLTSCQSTLDLTSTSTPVLIPTLISTPQPKATDTPYLTNSPEPTPTTLGDWPSLMALTSNRDCVTLHSTRPDNYKLSGALALLSLNAGKVGLEMSLLNLSDGVSKGITTSSNQPVWSADVSPDGQQVIYTWFNNSTSKWELIVLDATGEQQKVLWPSKEPVRTVHWLNNHQVSIMQSGTYFVLDLYSDHEIKFSSKDFPEFDDNTRPHFLVAFDSQMTRALYKDGGIILLDMSTKKIITRVIDAYYDRDPISDWQDSGDSVAVVGTVDTQEKMKLPADEIFVLERNGKAQQLTHIYDTFGYNIGIDGLSWSPDGGKIAFWANDWSKRYLMVADTHNGNLENFCITNIDSARFSMDIPAPIWSADGNQLIVENRYAQDKSRLLVIDIEKKMAFPIAENVFPVGWMISKP